MGESIQMRREENSMINSEGNDLETLEKKKLKKKNVIFPSYIIPVPRGELGEGNVPLIGHRVIALDEGTLGETFLLFQQRGFHVVNRTAEENFQLERG